MAAGDGISPMVLAKKLGVRPQQIYGMIRKNRINSWDEGGKTRVSEEEVTKAFSNPMKRGPKTDKVTAHDIQDVRSPVRVGDVVTWRTRDGVRIAQVRSQDPPFNLLKDLWGEQIFFRNHSLAKRISEGVAKIENPEGLLKMVAYWLLQNSQPELAAQLNNWTALNTEAMNHVGLSGRAAGDPARAEESQLQPEAPSAGGSDREPVLEPA